MHELYELKDKLMEELNEYAGKDLSAGSLEVVDKLTHTIKNLCKIMEEDEGYSGNGGYYEVDGMRGTYGRTRGGSYARGRGMTARRDSMGRYSREDGYSRDESMIAELKEIMQDAPEDTRMDFQKIIRKMENR